MSAKNRMNHLSFKSTVRLDFSMEVFCQCECEKMLSQEEDNRKQLFMAEMGNINGGTAEKDLIKMLIHLREKEFSRTAALSKQNLELELQEVFKDLVICLTVLQETTFL